MSKLWARRERPPKLSSKIEAQDTVPGASVPPVRHRLHTCDYPATTDLSPSMEWAPLPLTLLPITATMAPFCWRRSWSWRRQGEECPWGARQVRAGVRLEQAVHGGNRIKINAVASSGTFGDLRCPSVPRNPRSHAVRIRVPIQGCSAFLHRDQARKTSLRRCHRSARAAVIRHYRVKDISTSDSVGTPFKTHSLWKMC